MVLTCLSAKQSPAAGGILALGTPWPGGCYLCCGALDQKRTDTFKAPQHAAPICQVSKNALYMVADKLPTLTSSKFTLYLNSATHFYVL